MDIFDLTATVTLDTAPFVTAVRTMEQTARSFAGTISSALEQARQTASAGGYRVGAAIAQGVQSGIAAGSSSVYASIQSLCEGAVAAAKKDLGIASPSKVFADIGGFMAMGLSEGLGAGLDDTYRTLEDGLARLTGGGALPAELSADAAVRLTQSGSAGTDTGIGALLAEYLPQIAQRGTTVTIDAGSLVSAIAPDMDEALGRIRARGG